MKNKLEKFFAMPAPDRAVLLHALLLFPVFRAALLVAGLARVQSWLERNAQSPAAQTRLPEVEAAARLVETAARHSPVRPSCLVRSLALRWLLLRRGIDARLRIGARLEGGQLQAHAWIEFGGRPINDEPDAVSRFAVFPRP